MTDIPEPASAPAGVPPRASVPIAARLSDAPDAMDGLVAALGPYALIVIGLWARMHGVAEATADPIMGLGLFMLDPKRISGGAQ